LRQSPRTDTLPNASVNNGPENRTAKNPSSHQVRESPIAIAILMACADAAMTRVIFPGFLFCSLLRHQFTEAPCFRNHRPREAFTPGYRVFVGRQVEPL
jgi:hypothetical protein